MFIRRAEKSEEKMVPNANGMRKESCLTAGCWLYLRALDGMHPIEVFSMVLDELI